MKKITAVLLAVVILAAFACPAFAADEGRENLVIVYDDDYTEEYEYFGDFIPGENEIKFAPGFLGYYAFTPERSGVYALSGDSRYSLEIFRAGEEVSGEDRILPVETVTGEMNEEGYYEDSASLFYLKAGEEIFLTVWVWVEEESVETVEFSYLGRLEKIDFDNDKVYMLGDDIFFAEEDDEYYLNDEFTLVFSGTEEEYKTYGITLTADSTNDSSEFNCELLGGKFSFPIAIESVTDYICSVSVPEGKAPKAIETYDYTVYGAFPEAINVEFTDGSVAEFDVDTDYGEAVIELPNGRELWGGFYYTEDSQLIFTICDAEYEVGVTATPAGPVLNTVVLASNVNGIVTEEVLWAVEDALFLSEDPVNDFVSDITAIPDYIREEIGNYVDRVWSEGITVPEIKLF